MVNSYNNIELNKAPSPAFAIGTYTTGVELGTFTKENGFTFAGLHEEKDLLELHIFDSRCELRANYSNAKGDFIVQFIEDITQEYIDEYIQLFGEEYVANNDSGIILKEKGADKQIYINISKEQFLNKLSVGIRNYYDYDSNDIIKIVNYRLTGIYTGKGENKSIIEIKKGRE